MSQSVHIRRCHVCGKVNESCGNPVEKCFSCGKSIAPFYYFDEAGTETMSENCTRPVSTEGQFRPIYGLSTYW